MTRPAASPSTSSTTYGATSVRLACASAWARMMCEPRSSRRRCTSSTWLAKRPGRWPPRAPSPPPTDHRHALVAEEGGVAQVARRRRPGPQRPARRRGRVQRAGPGRHDQAVRRGTRRGRRRRRNGPLETSTRVASSVTNSAPNRSACPRKRNHQLRARDAVGEAREVLDVRGVHELPAGGEALDHERAQVGPGGVDGRGVAGAGAADDDDVTDVVHGDQAAARVGWPGCQATGQSSPVCSACSTRSVRRPSPDVLVAEVA